MTYEQIKLWVTKKSDVTNPFNPLTILTMTKEEKAKELIEKFKPLVTTWDCYWDVALPDDVVEADAKKCALICADEVICTLQSLAVSSLVTHKAYKEKQFWQSVKSHLQTSLKA